MVLDGNQDIAVLGLPLGGWGGMGASLTYEDAGLFDGRDAGGTSTGSFSARDFGVSAGLGFKGPAGLALGLALKANRQDFDGSVYDSYTGDVGLLWRISPALSLGGVYANLGPEVAGRPVAQGLRLGLSSYIAPGSDFQWLLSLSGEAQNLGQNALQGGLEARLLHVLALRAGYAFHQSQPPPYGLVGWTFGGGIALGSLDVDYAIVPLADLGNAQRVSVTLAFGSAPQPAP
jgi:hypothetical protein